MSQTGFAALLAPADGASAAPALPSILQTLAEEGITVPTSVQAQAIPALLDRADLRAQAATGSGKTLAYALPILLSLRIEHRVPQALILAPTRELCGQIVNEIRRFGRTLPGLRVLGLVGGEPIFGQARALEGGAHVLVATPGRLMDHLRRENIRLRNLELLVLDEADRMLDLGFEEAIQSILHDLPDRQTALLSATFPPEVTRLADAVLHEPVSLSIGAAPPLLEFRTLEAQDRLAALTGLLDRLNPSAALLFCNQKATVAELVGQIPGAVALQGDMLQEDRNDALARFRGGSARVLVATDVAARGLDIDGVELVVHCDLPTTPESWTHRSGRTGRAGAAGLAVALLRPGQQERLQRIIGMLPAPLEERPPLHPAPHPPLVTFRLGAGRRDKLRPGDILGALTKDAGLPASAIGLIDVQERVAFVTVAAPVAAAASLGLGRVKGRRMWVFKL